MFDSISGNLWFKLRTTEVNISRRRKYIVDFGGRLLLIVTSWKKNSVCIIVNFKTLGNGGSQVSRMQWEQVWMSGYFDCCWFAFLCVCVLGFLLLFLCVCCFFGGFFVWFIF